jgi:hypothetical protein
MIEMKVPKDRTKINSNDLGEFVWWSYHLGINMEVLLLIINEVGNSTEKIRLYNKSKKGKLTGE